MGCFLGCFGGSKDRKHRKQRRRVIPREQQRHGGQSFQTQNVVATEEGIKEPPQDNLVSELSDKPEEQLSSNSKKKVTFDSNVTTYEHVSVFGSVDSLREPESKEEDIGALPSDSRLTSEDDSVTSSVASYPPNHRYENCRDSDDEDMDCGDSELEDEDYEDDEDYGDYEEVDERIIDREPWSSGSVLTESMESRTDPNHLEDGAVLGEVESPMQTPFIPNREVKTAAPNGSARNRSDYVHPVLNPVENLSQWKTLKSKGISQLKAQKENLAADDLQAPIPFSSEPSFKPKSERTKNSNQEVAVDASLSTWLTCGSTPTKSSPGSVRNQGSNSIKSFEDRPILGALTVEELKHLSATSSPRKSPSRSPDEMPIIGTVGTYWNDSISSSSKESRSASSSFKGIPNTTSKYREDKRVNWHSTPFETRLERALNRGE